MDEIGSETTRVDQPPENLDRSAQERQPQEAGNSTSQGLGGSDATEETREDQKAGNWSASAQELRQSQEPESSIPEGTDDPGVPAKARGAGNSKASTQKQKGIDDSYIAEDASAPPLRLSREDQQSQETESSSSQGVEISENVSAPPLRPLTRSLTGRASKPRARDDSWYEPPKKTPAPRKKGKATRKRTIDEVDRAESEEPASPPPPPPPPETRAPDPEPVVPPLSGTQAHFVDVDPLASNRNGHNAYADPLLAGGRSSRMNLPVPVPNLIKKSRGRRVPVVAPNTGTAPSSIPGSEEASSAASKRMHVCKVEGCGKCFHRGEHLKRHIRSIHTHEKPFPCTYPSCHKFFNRHDNLLQHVKVHRNGDEDDGDVDGDQDEDLDAEGSPAPSDSRGPSMSPVVGVGVGVFHANPRHASNHKSKSKSRTKSRTNHGSGESFNATSELVAGLLRHASSTSITYPTPGAPSMGYGMSMGMGMGMGYGAPTHATTNMAVSSLRTELPDSPVKSAGPMYGAAYGYSDGYGYGEGEDTESPGTGMGKGKGGRVRGGVYDDADGDADADADADALGEHEHERGYEDTDAERSREQEQLSFPAPAHGHAASDVDGDLHRDRDAAMPLPAAPAAQAQYVPAPAPDAVMHATVPVPDAQAPVSQHYASVNSPTMQQLPPQQQQQSYYRLRTPPPPAMPQPPMQEWQAQAQAQATF